MKNKYITYIAAILIIVIIISGAFIYFNNGTASKPTNTQTNISVIDDEGTTTNFTSVPQRIISLAPSNTQIIFAIGVGNEVVGVTDYDHNPYNFTAWIAAGNLTSVGGFSTPITPRPNSRHTHQRPRRCYSQKSRLQCIGVKSQRR